MGAVTVLVALVCHKWVESLALSARCLKIGANWWYVHPSRVSCFRHAGLLNGDFWIRLANIIPSARCLWKLLNYLYTSSAGLASTKKHIG